jgi:hypothetical protein
VAAVVQQQKHISTNLPKGASAYAVPFLVVLGIRFMFVLAFLAKVQMFLRHYCRRPFFFDTNQWLCAVAFLK